jgi:hypothetical protein
VLQFNEAITNKIREFEKRADSIVVGNHNNQNIMQGLGLLTQEWIEMRRKLLLDQIYGSEVTNSSRSGHNIVGLFGGSSVSRNSNEQPRATKASFLFASSDASGKFHLNLPRRGVWCFFVTAKSPVETCYWFKRQSISFNGKTVEITTNNCEYFTADLRPNPYGDIAPTKADFIVKSLQRAYGLECEPPLDIAAHPGYSAYLINRIPGPRGNIVKSVGDGEHPWSYLHDLFHTSKKGHLNPLATVLWIAVGLGYLSYAHSRKSLASFMGALLIFVAVFVAPSWVWVSICCGVLMAIVFVFAREGY